MPDGILGEPDAELVDLLGVIEEIQQQVRSPIRRGAVGAEIFGAAHKTLDTSPHRAYLDFAAHGMGLVSHEAPRQINDGSMPYEAYDATRPLEAGMVISIETTMAHPRRGFIKLEDTVAVTEGGCESFGEKGRLEPGEVIIEAGLHAVQRLRDQSRRDPCRNPKSRPCGT